MSIYIKTSSYNNLTINIDNNILEEIDKIFFGKKNKSEMIIAKKGK